MTLRRFSGLLLSLFLIVPIASAAELGKAEGTVTINRKPVKLQYAYAKTDKDSEEKDRFVVLLTDRPVPRSLLTDDYRLSKAVEAGDVAYVLLTFDAAKALENAEVKSKALQHKSMPLTSSEMTVTAPVFGANAVEASVATTKDMEFFSDVATLKVKFAAPLGKDKYGDNALAMKALAASAPKIADGGAVGTMKVDGKTVKLTHTIARTRPNSFDEKKRDVVVLLSNTPVPAETFIDESKLFAQVKEGTIQGLLVKIDSDEKPYHLQLLHPSTSMQLSGSGIFNFDATDFSEQHVTGRFYTKGEEEFMGKNKYSYDVSFATPVQKLVAPDEITVDASTGTKLPPNGGDPGKAYLAFDKAGRAGNLKELAKFASKTNPLPEMSAAEMKEMAEMLKMMRPAKLKILGGFISGNHATLNVEGEDPSDKSKMRGTIEMVLEDGSWKLLAEKWKMGG